jgi:hypothetical protein
MPMQRRLEYPAKGFAVFGFVFYLETESAHTTPGNLSAAAHFPEYWAVSWARIAAASAAATWSGVGATAARTIGEGFRAPPENMPKTGRRTDGLK